MFTVAFVVQQFLLGIGVGIISAALGLGGGVVMVPAFLAFVPHMDAHTAKGTSLFIIIFVSGLNAWRQNRGQDKQWKLVGLLAGGSVIGSYLSAYITSLMSEEAILVLFILLMAIVAWRTFSLRAPAHVDHVAWRPWRSFGIGLVAGITGGSTGTGGGAILIPLALIAGIVVNERVVGLSNLVMIFTSIAGSIAHLQAPAIYDAPGTIGHVSLLLVPLVFLGAQVGSEIGYRINNVLSLKYRRLFMGGMLLMISLELLYRLLSRA